MSKPYVYELVDPRDNSVFYVGKGRRNRAYQHENDVRRGKILNVEKTCQIASILACGLHVIVNIVSWHDLDIEAGRAEAALIAAIGIDNLTNVQPGGFWHRCGEASIYAGQDLRRVAIRTMDLLVRLLKPKDGERRGWFEFFVKVFQDILSSICLRLGTEKYDFIVNEWFAKRAARRLEAAKAEIARRGLVVAV